ncbi:MAG: hypothetical protein WBF52_04630, partial [Geitlerinemataceae cyanobacterium]
MSPGNCGQRNERLTPQTSPPATTRGNLRQETQAVGERFSGSSRSLQSCADTVLPGQPVQVKGKRVR